MSQAWKIILALTLARAAMGVQFQALPALAAPLLADGQMGHAALGTLTGAYLLPGVVAALAGGWLGQTVGDIRTACAGLFLMVLGGLGEWASASFGADLAFRVLAGTGAVALNVMVTKMAADWFQDRADLPVAMGVLVSSWPAGLALAMLVLPLVAAVAGLTTALLLPTAFAAVCLVLLAVLWTAPPARAGRAPASAALTRRELGLVLHAGLIWGIYNAAFIVAIAWTPGVFDLAGVPPAQAAALVSLVGWSAILSVAAGGWLAARAPSRDMPTILCFAGAAVLFVALPAGGAALANPAAMIALGLILGPPAALIMTLPVEAARPEARAVAMGIYLAVYYAAMGLAPPLMGAVREASGSAAAPLYLGAALLVASLALLALFRRRMRAGDDFL